ncbi:hypothetical protein EON79_06190 [bacterium]|nr:MAG: hypothetical protein EON79_06190 [bacterium]
MGIDSTIWYLGSIGLFLTAFGWKSLRANLPARSAKAFRTSLLLFWALAAIRWTSCDEIALAVWIYITGGYIARRLYRSEGAATSPA